MGTGCGTRGSRILTGRGAEPFPSLQPPGRTARRVRAVTAVPEPLRPRTNALAALPVRCHCGDSRRLSAGNPSPWVPHTAAPTPRPRGRSTAWHRPVGSRAPRRAPAATPTGRRRVSIASLLLPTEPPLLAPPPSRCARFHTHLPPASPSPQVPHQSMPRGRSTAAPPGAPSAAPRAGHPAVTRTEPRTVGDSSPGRGGRGAGNVTPTSPTASAPQRSAAPTAPPRRSPAAVRSPCSRSSPQGVGTWRGGLPSPTSPPSPWCLTRPHCCKDAQRCGGVGRGQLEPGGWGGEGVGLVSLGGLKQCHRDGEAEPPMGKAVQ